MTFQTTVAGPQHLDAVATLDAPEHRHARGVDPLLAAFSPLPGDLAGTVGLRDGAVVGTWLAAPAGGAQAGTAGAGHRPPPGGVAGVRPGRRRLLRPPPFASSR